MKLLVLDDPQQQYLLYVLTQYCQGGLAARRTGDRRPNLPEPRDRPRGPDRDPPGPR
jgi:hypothetical protein